MFKVINMKMDEHKKRLKEHLDAVEWAIKRGLRESQSTIGFHVPAALVEMVSIYLRQQKLIPEGMQVNHLWFRSLKKADEVFPFEFRNKQKIFGLMKEIEEKRDSLVYGITKEEKEIEKFLENFHRLRTILEDMIK